ncbi:MAG: glycosyltransferase [Actinomycetota bacterium]|nr:glycosyltransferase [Actinomycetota bacterium]
MPEDHVDVSVIVPTRNEAGNVAELVHRLDAALADPYEVIFVDDSDDDTPDVIAEVGRTATRPVRLVHRSPADRAGGLGGAVREGLRHSAGPWAVVMDGDLQHPPEDVPRLVERAREGSADVVVASRYVGEGDAGGLANGVRRAVSSGSTTVTKALFPRRLRDCTDPMTGFFAVRREAVAVEDLRPMGFKILLELLVRQPLRVAEVPFTFAERHAGESKAGLREGFRFLQQLLSLRLGRVALFALVGAVGFVLNLAVMALAVGAGLHYVAAAVLGTELTILTNFLLQERLVFHDWLGGRTMRSRLVRSLAFNNVEALVRTPFLVLLVEQLAVPSVPAQGLTLVVAFAARFTFASRVVYGATSTQEPCPESLASPPGDDEKYAYLAGGQQRWVFPLQTAAFAGVAVSLAGFAGISYWTLLFLLPLSLFAAEQLLALRTSTYPRRVTLDEHRARVEGWRPAWYPSVDVFLPSAGEGLALLENTYGHVAALDWPGRLHVLVLDDSGRESVRRLADRFGFDYLARPGREFKKAGNLRYGYDRSDGDLIAILDADFVPRPDYLRELAPYFDDAGVGIVQSPQYFDTTPELGWLERSAGATQEMFYRLIQPSRDAVGAAICVGSCAIYRREALDAAGGFPMIGHSEDVYTGLAMSRVGYELRYVPVLVSKGVCPDGLNTFITQQYRWCEGSLSLAADPAFHADPTMTLAQRLCYWSGFLYYVSTAVAVFLAPLPVLVMALWFPENVFAVNMLPLVGALVLWLAVYPLLFVGRWRVEVLRVQALYSFAHALSLVHAIRGRSADWVPSHTADRSKATSVAATVRLVLTVYLGATQLALAVVLALRTVQFGLADWWATIAFALFNAYVFVPLAWQGLAGVLAERRARPAEPLLTPYPEKVNAA